ncbi:protein BTG2-like [Argiope bruennichi]|uniref:Protein BTG2 like protein n=1 Tax=Argiope bruennichi TaxID=94029 RepID=A0A8T0FQM5_ARGBR|nr:protein BTG2-like [Argiope bruennichi]KAF8793126.1 Protein BTG2 like protein [Argiope bruennichi]
MKLEVQYAVDFLITLLRKKCKNTTKVEHFRREITNLLLKHISEHWYPQNSQQGSGYRCIRIQSLKIDPIVLKAARACGFNNKIFSDIFPEDFTLWIDPYDVCYRIGEYGSCSPLYFIPEPERPEEHRPKTPTRSYHGTPKRSVAMKIKKIQTDYEDSSDSCSPMSISPPSPTYVHPNSCKQSFQHSPFNQGFGVSAYVAS